MTRYTVDLTRAELDLICEAISAAGFPAGGAAEVWGDSEAQVLTVALSETAIDCLSNLPDYTDWHCSDGQLYADGAVYPLTVVHNA
jgi:hypothetical protein